MLIQLILSLLVGILAGTFTGLFPGIHINLVGAMLVSITSTTFFISPLYSIVFISAMAITHTFLDFIPSIFLGAPDTDTQLSILPGHELLKQGKGYEAVMLTAYGGLIAIFLLLLITFPSIFIMQKVYPLLLKIMPFILIGISLLMLFFEKRKFSALFVFLLSGILGLIVLNFPETLLNQPLLPLLGGLFGSSTLILSIKTKTQIPKQEITYQKIKFLKPILGTLIASPLCSFLPGLGSSQAAIIGNTIINKKRDNREFLVLLGATNTLVMGLSFVALYAISKTRTGAAAAIKELIGIPNIKILILILIVVSISGIVSFFLTKILSIWFLKIIEKVNYTKLSIATLIILSIVVFLVSGFLGLAVFVISTATGIYCISFNVRRTNMMGCLLLPTIVLYLI